MIATGPCIEVISRIGVERLPHDPRDSRSTPIIESGLGERQIRQAAEPADAAGEP
jgi:hypothetical protein